VNDAGAVLAHPQPDLIQQQDGDVLRTVTIAELDDSLARSAVASYVEQGADRDTTLTEFDGGDEVGTARGSFRTVAVGRGDWTVGVFGPEDSLVGGLASARGAERTLLAIAGAISLLLGAVIFSRATRPLDELEQHAWSDSLTGLANRRSILRTVDREVVDSEHVVSLAILDIDRFKRVNDTYGHQVGDEVLIEVARRAEASLTKGATIGRLGGEEFLIVMPDCDESAAWDLCERIRTSVQASPIQHSDGALDVTVSLGLASGRGPTPRGQLISLADVALLHAKSSGRDKVVSGSSITH